MSVVWNDEYDPDELGDGFRIETWDSSIEMDEAEEWLATQDVPDWTEDDQ